MKTLTLVTLLFFVTNLTQGQDINIEADSLLDQLITENKLIGVSGAYAVHGKTEWLSAKGYANKEDNIPFNTITKTRTASITKSFTAVAIMQLVERGKIDLHAPIQTYFKSFPKFEQGEITVHQLLSHTSGLDSYRTTKERETKKEYTNLEEATSIFRDWDLRFKPGTQYHYSTYGYVVLGVIIEKVSGLSYSQYIQHHILDKAGMKSTGIEKYGHHVENKSELYHRSRKGKVKKAKTNNLSNRLPAGGYYSTAEDLLRFGNAIINNTLIKKETLELMTQHHSLEKFANGYGYGWFLYGPKENEGVLIGHSGEQTGVSAQLFIIPKRKTVLTILGNTSGSWNDVAKATAALIPIAEKQNN